MPDSAILALAFEVIMSHRHWVKASLHTQHIYIAAHYQQCRCAFARARVHMYLYYIMYASMCCVSLIMLRYLYACGSLCLCSRVYLHTVVVLHLRGFEHHKMLSYIIVTVTICRYNEAKESGDVLLQSCCIR